MFTNIELAGLFKLVVSGGARGTIETEWFPNMILDSGIQYMLSDTRSFNAIAFCSVGSSSEPVEPTQVGLVSHIARSALNRDAPTFGWDNDGGYNYNVKTISFARGAAAGNISEISMEIANNSNSPAATWCRALVLDEHGSPTTITVLADEVLTVTYELRRWFNPPAPHVIQFDNDGETFETTVSYNQGKNYNSDFIGNSLGAEIIANGVAVKSQGWAESQGNPNISSMDALSVSVSGSLFPPIYSYATFTPPIPKTNEFTVSIEQTFSLTRRAP